jgi:hypothetical protein
VALDGPQKPGQKCLKANAIVIVRAAIAGRAKMTYVNAETLSKMSSGKTLRKEFRSKPVSKLNLILVAASEV